MKVEARTDEHLHEPPSKEHSTDQRRPGRERSVRRPGHPEERDRDEPACPEEREQARFGREHN